jgi:DNA-3-methyladenine glycosylase II
LIDGEAALEAAVEMLLTRDPDAIAPMLAVTGAPPLRRREPGFAGLVSIIISQQVSVASANAIGARLCKTLVPLEPKIVASASDELLRSCGLSGAKIRTLRALSAAILEGRLALDALAAMPPEEAHRALVAVKGIGPWTADIFLMFCLGHSDVWPAGDLALQEAARLALKLEARPDARRLTALGERWRPHRGVAARLLWAYYRAVKGREGIGGGTGAAAPSKRRIRQTATP